MHAVVFATKLSFYNLFPVIELSILVSKHVCTHLLFVKSHLPNIGLPALILLGFAIVFIYNGLVNCR